MMPFSLYVTKRVVQEQVALITPLLHSNANFGSTRKLLQVSSVYMCDIGQRIPIDLEHVILSITPIPGLPGRGDSIHMHAQPQLKIIGTRPSIG